MFRFGFKQIVGFLLSVFLYLVYYFRFRWGCSVYRFNYDSVKLDGSDYVEGFGWLDKYNFVLNIKEKEFEFLFGGHIDSSVRFRAYERLKNIKSDKFVSYHSSKEENKTYIKDFDKAYEEETDFFNKKQMNKYVLLYDFLRAYPYLLITDTQKEKETGKETGVVKYLNLRSVVENLTIEGGKEFTEQFYDFSFFDATYFSEYEYLLFNQLFSGRLDRNEFGDWIYRYGRCETDFVTSKVGTELLADYHQKQDDYVLLRDLKVVFCDYYKMVLLVRVNIRYSGFEIVAVHKYKFNFVYEQARAMLTSFSPVYGGWLGKKFVNDVVDGKLDLMGEIRINRYKTLRSEAGK